MKNAFDLYMNGLLRGCFTDKRKGLDWRAQYIAVQPKVKEFEHYFKEVKLNKDGSHPERVEINPKFKKD